MATPNVGILTNAGKNLIDQVNAGQTKITFSKIVFSSMDNSQLTDDQVKALTAITPQEVVVDSPEVTLDNNTGETRIRATGTNEALTDGVYVKTYAVYAKDDSGNEILYGITVSPNPNYLPEYDGVTPQVVTYSYKVNISNTSNITFTNSNDVYASETDLAEALQPYAKTVDVNQQLDKKVTDNKDGTEQLNGVQVQPYNKLSDTIGGRNLLRGTSGTLQTVTNASGYNTGLPSITPMETKVDSDTVYTARAWLAPASHDMQTQLVWTDSSGTTTYYAGGNTISAGTSGYSTMTVTLPAGSTVQRVTIIFTTAQSTPSTVSYKEMKFEQGSIATDWTPAPEDKVNVSDMRKPASDVAGIEEVNAKQDAIGYTPADDSKVAHLSGANNFDTIPTVNNNPLLLASSLPSDLARTGQSNTFNSLQTFSQGIKTLQTGSYDDVNSLVNEGLYFNTNLSIKNGAGIITAGFIQVISGMWDRIRQIMYSDVDGTLIYTRTSMDGGSTWGDWIQIITGQNANFTGKLQRNGKDVATTDDLTIVYAGVPSLSFDNNGNYTITASKNADIAHITDYTLYYRVKGNGDFTQVALTPDKLTGTVDLSKVTMATSFESYATATNVFGESDPSSTVQWNYDPEKASSTPPSLAIADDGTYTITAPTTTPTPIVKYFLYYNVDGQSDATKLDVGTELTGSLKELITKPNKTTTYDVQATAMNANAESGVSNSVQFTYVPIDDSIYGASWDRKSSPTLTRTDAAVGLKAGINGAQNDFDSVGPWKGMHRVTDSMNNVFVRIPKFYIRKTQTGSPDNGTATWQVSLVSHGDDWYLPKCFWDFTNSKELDYIDIGAYDATGSSSKLTSVAGQAPLVNLSIADFRSAAKANGTGYQIWDIHANDMLQVLFIIEFATLDSQSIMEGVDNGSSAAKSGAADSHKGSSGTAGSGSNAMSYRGIENLYGNVWQFCDGANFKNNQPWVCEDATKYQSDLFAAPYVSTSYAATSSGYIKALGLDNAHPYAQFSIDDSGSESAYYADYDYQGSGNTVFETGGSWVTGALVGLFDSRRDNSSTYAGAGAGCRLLKKALL